MIEPVELQDFFAAFFSGAMVVLSGALYALLFAWSRVHGPARMMVLAYAAYGLLVVSVVVLSHALHLSGFWRIMVATLLVGYLLAPHGIWHLCVGTHPDAGPGGVGPRH
jgi:hypothetical protein